MTDLWCDSDESSLVLMRLHMATCEVFFLGFFFLNFVFKMHAPDTTEQQAHGVSWSTSYSMFNIFCLPCFCVTSYGSEILCMWQSVLAFPLNLPAEFALLGMKQTPLCHISCLHWQMRMLIQIFRTSLNSASISFSIVFYLAQRRRRDSDIKQHCIARSSCPSCLIFFSVK